MAYSYTFEPEQGRVAAYTKLEGGEVKEVGELTFRVEDKRWVADHTFVHEDYRGGPIAGEMLKLLVEQARKQGIKIKPVCSYVVKSFERIPEYKDVASD